MAENYQEHPTIFRLQVKSSTTSSILTETNRPKWLKFSRTLDNISSVSQEFVDVFNFKQAGIEQNGWNYQRRSTMSSVSQEFYSVFNFN